MKLVFIGRCWLACLFFFSAAVAHADLPAPVSAALKVAGIPEQSVSVFVQRVDQPEPLVAHRADQPMNPASTMKLLTTYAGLEILGPAYTWPTEVYGSVPLQGDVLDGDLIIKGYGDPAMMLEDFWMLTRTLRNKGVRDIRGNLVLDRSYFNGEPFDPGAFDGEPYRGYNAGPDAFLVNLKATRFIIRSDNQAGDIKITADPDLPSIRVENLLVPAEGMCGNWKNQLAYEVTRQPDATVITFRGRYARDCQEQTLNLSLANDATYAFELFRQLWQAQGGGFNGQLKSGAVTLESIPLMQFNSPPLADVVRLINKYSNNLMARQLLLTLGAARDGAPADVVSGALAIKDWLDTKGLVFDELVIENGSGLSRIGRISAQHLGELLRSAYASPVMPEFLSSLPVIALDGTLEKRLVGTELMGRGHLKTGSLESVRAIAGYVLDQQGHRWAVVFMAEHARAYDTRAAQDALLNWVYRMQ